MGTDVEGQGGAKATGVVVHYGKKKFDLTTDSPTGAELYTAFGIPAGNKLFLETPSDKDPDKPVANDATPFQVKNGSHFYDLPPGTVG